MPDAHKNFAISAVATAPSPAASGTSLVVTSGHGARFPAVPFNATVWPDGATPDPTNAEIVRVTARSTDTLTIVRARESSSARSIVVGDKIAATITARSLLDAEYLMFPSPGGLLSGGHVAPVYNNIAEFSTRGLTRWMYVYLYGGETFDGIVYRSWTQGSGTTVRAAVYDARASLLNPTLIAATEVSGALSASGSVVTIAISTWTVPGDGYYAFAGGLVGGTGSVYGASPIPQAANLAADLPTALSMAQDNWQALTTAMPAVLAGVASSSQINTSPIFQLRKV